MKTLKQFVCGLALASVVSSANAVYCTNQYPLSMLDVPSPTGYGLVPNYFKVNAYGSGAQRFIWQRMKWYTWERMDTLRNNNIRSYEADMFLIPTRDSQNLLTTWVTGMAYVWSNIVGYYRDTGFLDILDSNHVNVSVGTPWSGTMYPNHEWWTLIQGVPGTVSSSPYFARAQRGEQVGFPYTQPGTFNVFSCSNGPNSINMHNVGEASVPGCWESWHPTSSSVPQKLEKIGVYGCPFGG